MTTAREAAQRVLLQRHVIDQLQEQHKADTAAAVASLDVGDKKVADLDGIPLGKVELRTGSVKVQIEDRPQFIVWALQLHPDWFVPEPDTNRLQDAILETRRGAYDPATLALLLDAATAWLHQLQRQPRNQLREGVERGLLDNVKDNGGQRVDPESGEVEDVPGVVVYTAPPVPTITIDRKKGAPELVRGMLAGGGLPAMPALTTGEE